MRMTDEGLLIEFFNDPTRRLFRDGASEMTDDGIFLFRIVAWNLSKHISRESTLVEVEGHTNESFTKEHPDKDEWVVSTDRALKVRKFMEREGMKPHQFQKVAGYGNRRPHKNYPKDHAYHNRVSIMVRPR